MTLPASGPLTIGQILAEIGDSYPVTIPNANWRLLAGKPTGSLVIPNDFWGKSWKSAAYMGLVADSASISFGDARADRRIVAVIHWSEGGTHRTLSSATIGGVAATVHVQRGHSGGSTGLGAAIISALVPTGTTGAVVCTFSGGGTADVSCGVYRLTGLTSGTPTDTDSAESQVTTTDITVTITMAAEGIVIAGYTGSTNATSVVTWTGVTEQYDGEDNIHRSGGFASGISAGSRVITADITPQANSGNDLVVATWS